MTLGPRNMKRFAATHPDVAAELARLREQVRSLRSRAEMAEECLRDRCENRMDGEEALVAAFAHGLRHAADTMDRVVGSIGGPLFVGMALTLRDMATAVEKGDVPMPAAGAQSESTGEKR